MYFVGIDVGSKELVMVVRRKGKAYKPRRFSNNAEGHKQIVNALSPAKKQGRICLEATGVYHFDLAVALSSCPGFEVMVVNPRASRHFARALMTRTKTDLIDADILAQYVEIMPFEQWQVPDKKTLELRAFSRKIAAVTRLKVQMKNQIHALLASEYPPDIIVEETLSAVAFFDEQIKRLKDHALMLISSSADLQESFDIITSTTGIADTSAIQLLGELLVLPKDMNNRQWVAFAGLDPRQHQSGTSVAKKTRISKAGNHYLRQALYMPALCAATRDRHVRAYYMHLIENRGLKKIQALCAVMRKMLHAIHAMLKNKTAFDNTKFFRIEGQNNSV